MSFFLPLLFRDTMDGHVAISSADVYRSLELCHASWKSQRRGLYAVGFRKQSAVWNKSLSLGSNHNNLSFSRSGLDLLICLPGRCQSYSFVFNLSTNTTWRCCNGWLATQEIHFQIRVISKTRQVYIYKVTITLRAIKQQIQTQKNN